MDLIYWLKTATLTAVAENIVMYYKITNAVVLRCSALHAVLLCECLC